MKYKTCTTCGSINHIFIVKGKTYIVCYICNTAEEVKNEKK